MKPWAQGCHGILSLQGSLENQAGEGTKLWLGDLMWPWQRVIYPSYFQPLGFCRTLMRSSIEIQLLIILLYPIK